MDFKRLSKPASHNTVVMGTSRAVGKHLSYQKYIRRMNESLRNPVSTHVSLQWTKIVDNVKHINIFTLRNIFSDNSTKKIRETENLLFFFWTRQQQLLELNVKS